MKVLIIFVILCVFVLTIAAVEDDKKSNDLTEATRSLSHPHIDEHVRSERAAGKKGRKVGKKGKRRGGRKAPKKGRRPSPARKISRKGRKSHHGRS